MIVPALVPYGPEWHNKIASEFAIQGDAFDFAMWDSQSTAEFAGGGHAVRFNDIFATSDYLKADIFPASSLVHDGVTGAQAYDLFRDLRRPQAA